ncbi:MAG: threonine synthase [Chloroflexi bacterium]|nr:threonine synthase [Chloroflexota bacterium]
MSFATGLRCRKCGQEYPLQPLKVCDFCLSPVEVNYDYKAMIQAVSRQSIASGPATIWRYRDLLPVETKDEIDLGTGMTPLVKADNLGWELGLERLYIKNDCLTPTYSFKDRAVAVAVNKAKEFGFNTVACASTGNLAASVAAHAAKAGMRAYVFVPSNVEPGKLVGVSIYKPNLVTVEGSYDDVNRLCAEVAQKYNWGFININLRPYYAEGSKTLGYEVAEQLGWQSPDCVVAPAASGLLFTRIWKGLQELSMLKLIEPVNTHMYLTQATGSSPIVKAYEAGSLHIHPVTPNTIVTSIAIGNPADGYYALMVARQSGGGAQDVNDEEAIEGMKLLAETEGIFAEAAGGVVIAGLRKLVQSGKIHKDQLTVAFITGAGPRTQEIVSDVVQPVKVEPNLKSFSEVAGVGV